MIIYVNLCKNHKNHKNNLKKKFLIYVNHKNNFKKNFNLC